MITFKTPAYKIATTTIGVIILLLLQVKSFGQYISIEGCPTIRGFELVDDGSVPCLGKSITRRVLFEDAKIGEVRWEFDGVRTQIQPHPNGFTVVTNGITYHNATDRPTLTSPGYTNAKVTIVPKPNQRYYPRGIDVSAPTLPCPVVNSTMGNMLDVCPAPPPGTCPRPLTIKRTNSCIGEPMIFCVDLAPSTIPVSKIQWEFTPASGASTILEGSSVIYDHGLTAEGYFDVKVTLNPHLPMTECGGPAASSLTNRIFVVECEPDICPSCTRTFVPMPGKNYLLSAWVKEQNSPYQDRYIMGSIKINFQDVCSTGNNTSSTFTPSFFASGPIIDGWQKIEQEFRVPVFTNSFSLELQNTGPYGDVFFDDIRIYPTDANMRTFVYDQSTHRLLAEGDENNYSAFFEYDEEGNLVRTKKETERGIKTIQENRQHQVQTIGETNN